MKDLKPEVVFQDLDKIYSDDQWRLLASTAKNTVFQFSSQTWIYDVRLSAGNSIGLPVLPVEGLTQLLYVFKGDVTVNKHSN